MTKIEVIGHLDEKWKDWFDGMDITIDGENTILSGNIIDESYLHGILNRIRDLNLKLISVNSTDGNNNFNNGDLQNEVIVIARSLRRSNPLTLF